MAKKRTHEEDKAILEKKVKERRAGSENPEGDPDARQLRKRLKRVQRKIRLSTSRIATAAGNKAKAA
ncbi:MAG: hypothetical protein F4201_10340 [Nitrospira sp. SB0677_bin_15]|nr:hypothetical protein [Nitrospira sp. SB0667_bin_9]MYD31703.1 hypothetical protein [Nitrospira sp. SB0661_bin_20]MYG41192.1 hypothetical protein [Nitrospira sp. SB0677_bin_15]MYH01432.1 hypothetical protein [Nitrospira sp. SB0675_bin_23]MYJ22659.1 hypothetical protein [Nitrospira sp. SB0673_bin_12]